jgi:hypothetical protein
MNTTSTREGQRVSTPAQADPNITVTYDDNGVTLWIQSRPPLPLTVDGAVGLVIALCAALTEHGDRRKLKAAIDEAMRGDTPDDTRDLDDDNGGDS